jgi:hypothetical protein
MEAKKKTAVLKVKQEEISGHGNRASKPSYINILCTLLSLPFTCQQVRMNGAGMVG